MQLIIKKKKKKQKTKTFKRVFRVSCIHFNRKKKKKKKVVIFDASIFIQMQNFVIHWLELVSILY